MKLLRLLRPRAPLLLVDETRALFWHRGEGAPFTPREENWRQGVSLDASPLILLADTQDISIKSDIAPENLSRTDRLNLWRRRLANAHRHTELRAVLPLSRQEALFLAAPDKGALGAWQDKAKAAGYSSVGVALLPMELSDWPQRLLRGKEGEWTLLLLIGEKGASRHIVLRQGKPVFTRRFPAPATATNSAAQERLVQHAEATRRYLDRLGLKPKDRMTLIVVGPEDIKNASPFAGRAGFDVHFFTSGEAAHLLPLPADLPPVMKTDAFLLALGWIGHRVPARVLYTKANARLQKSFYLRRAGKIALNMALMAALALCLHLSSQLWTRHIALKDARRDIAVLSGQIEKARSASDGLSGSLQKWRKAVERRRIFTRAPEHDWVDVSRTLASTLEATALATRVTWTENEMQLTLQEPDKSDGADRVWTAPYANDLRNRLSKALPAYELFLSHPDAPQDDEAPVTNAPHREPTATTLVLRGRK